VRDRARFRLVPPPPALLERFPARRFFFGITLCSDVEPVEERFAEWRRAGPALRVVRPVRAAAARARTILINFARARNCAGLAFAFRRFDFAALRVTDRFGDGGLIMYGFPRIIFQRRMINRLP